MSSTIITVLLVGLMLSISISLVARARHLQRRRERLAVQQTTSLSLNYLAAPVTAPLAREGIKQGEQIMSVRWYRRHRIIVSGALILMLMLALFVQTGLADGAFNTIRQGIGAFSLSGNPQGFSISTELPPMPFSAAQHVVRYDSAARDQYYTNYEWQVWSFSSCSGFAMETVINSYGHSYIAADFLEKEYSLGIWNISDGLTGGEAGIALTASYFGFKALPNSPRTLQALIYSVNKGYPVIVGSPAHIMVAYGADNTYIYVADSSPVDRTSMTYAQFMSWWDGFSVVLVPR